MSYYRCPKCGLKNDSCECINFEEKNMPCCDEFPASLSLKWEAHLRMMLEQAFRYLSKEQILTIKGSDTGWIYLV